jgi:hypothetical protein
VATLSQNQPASNVSIRAMHRTDLEEARKIFRVAFGTFLGVPEPESFWADREYVFTRWQADPEAALVAEVNGRLAGSNFVTNWGSFGFFGPLTILPESGISVSHSNCWGQPWIFLGSGGCERPVYSRSHTVRNTSLYTRNLDSGRDSLRPSCPRVQKVARSRW